MPKRVDLSIFESELERLIRYVAASPDRETGGELLGLWTNGGGATVMLVTGPSPDALREPTRFAQPAAVHMAIEQFVWTQFGMQVLGLWHSHHRLGLPALSQGDRARTRRYAQRHGRRSYAEILGHLGGIHGHQVDLVPHIYVDATELRELPTVLRPLPGLSPIRRRLETEPPPALIAPCLDIPETTGRLEASTWVDRPAVEERSATPTGEEAILLAIEQALQQLPQRFASTVTLDVGWRSLTINCLEGGDHRRIEIDTTNPKRLWVTSTAFFGRMTRELRASEGEGLPEFYTRVLRAERKNMVARLRRALLKGAGR